MTVEMTRRNPGHEVFERIAHAAAASIGFRLFTVTAFDAATMQVQRIYSSDPSAYPVGGRKPKRDTEFARQVLVAGQPLVCEGDAAISRVFDDHPTIFALGLHSSINAPVMAGERCIGVLNFLMTAHELTRAQVDAACAFARDAVIIAVLSASRSRCVPPGD